MASSGSSLPGSASSPAEGSEKQKATATSLAESLSAEPCDDSHCIAFRKWNDEKQGKIREEREEYILKGIDERNGIISRQDREIKIKDREMKVKDRQIENLEARLEALQAKAEKKDQQDDSRSESAFHSIFDRALQLFALQRSHLRSIDVNLKAQMKSLNHFSQTMESKLEELMLPISDQLSPEDLDRISKLRRYIETNVEDECVFMGATIRRVKKAADGIDTTIMDYGDFAASIQQTFKFTCERDTRTLAQNLVSRDGKSSSTDPPAALHTAAKSTSSTSNLHSQSFPASEQPLENLDLEPVVNRGKVEVKHLPTRSRQSHLVIPDIDHLSRTLARISIDSEHQLQPHQSGGGVVDASESDRATATEGHTERAPKIADSGLLGRLVRATKRALDESDKINEPDSKRYKKS